MNEYIKSIRALVNGEKSDLDISKLLYKHNCFYLLSKYCESDTVTNFRSYERVLNKISIDQRLKTCQGLFKSFAENNIPYAVVKGAVLSQAAYNDPYVRRSGDIDIIIRRSDADLTKKLMYEDGFIQGGVTDSGVTPFSRKELLFQSAMSHQMAPFIKESLNKMCPYVNVDINLDLMWGESDVKADMNFVLGYTQTTSIGGIEFNKLTPEMEFIALCLHHYKDMNSLYLLYTKGLTLGLFCDIYYYSKNTLLDVQKLMSISRVMNVCEYIYYCLYYTNMIFGDTKLEEYCKLFESGCDISILNSFGLAADENYEWNIDFFDRLFEVDISTYLKNTITEKHFERIKLNSKNM